MTDKAGLHDVGWASGVCVGDYNNDGFEDLFCTTLGKTSSTRTMATARSTDVTKEAGLLNDLPRYGAGCTFLGLQSRWFSGSFRFELCSSTSIGPGARPEHRLTWKGIDVECGHAVCRTECTRSIAIMATAPLLTSATKPGSRLHGAAMA